MNRQLTIGLGVAALILLFLASSALYTVHQTQQALVLQFGDPVRVVKEPGLRVKLPLIQQVEFFERRVLGLDVPPVEVILGDQRRLVVDSFARYRIADPLRFRQSVGSESAFIARLEPILYSSLRSVLGEVSLFELLSKDRDKLMARIRDNTNTELQRFGVQVVDVRIKRADLPKENSEAIFRRMRAERLREANELRAQGAEVAQRIRARADRERTVLVAQANRDSQVLRGEGDSSAIRIFAEAFGEDPEFFAFYRSMQAYRAALGDEQTNFVLSPRSEFFRFFNRLGLDTGSPGKVEGAPAAPSASVTGGEPAATASTPTAVAD